MTAKDLIEAGCTSIADMKKPKYFDTLTPQQQIGVRYHEHLERPVERCHAEQLIVRRFITRRTFLWLTTA